MILSKADKISIKAPPNNPEHRFSYHFYKWVSRKEFEGKEIKFYLSYRRQVLVSVRLNALTESLYLLDRILDYGVGPFATDVYLYNTGRETVEIEGLWEEYIAKGVCAFSPYLSESYTHLYEYNGNNRRVCVHCGETQEIFTYIKYEEKKFWQTVVTQKS